MRRHQCVAAINECLYKRPAARMWLVAVERAQQFGGRPGLVVCRCHDREMSMLVTGWVGSTTSGVIAEVVGHSLSERSARAKEYREGRKTTAAELATPLREFQSLLRRYGKEPVDRAEVETACWNWSVTLAAQGHRLPWEWRHVPRNVREAVGTVFGAVVARRALWLRRSIDPVARFWIPGSGGLGCARLRATAQGVSSFLA